MGKNLKYSLVVLLAITMSIMAATAGKLKGVVTDESGEALAGANILIDGTTLGAESDEEGYYYMIGVRAGSYKVTCQFMGYAPSVQTIKVRTGLTSKLNFKLYPMDFELDEVVYEIDATTTVQADVTTSRRTIGSEAMELDVVTDADDVVAKQAGVKSDSNGFLHFRGGRSGEVNYQVDGISLKDPTGTNTNQTSIDAANIEEITVMKGVPTANYGNALSGNVNIVLKVGDQEKTRGRVKYTTDSFLDEENSTNYDKGEFSLSGPVPFTGLKIKPTYFVSMDLSSSDGMNAKYMNATGSDYFERDDFDITGFGFDIAQRRINNFNMVAKLAYDITDKMKISTSYTRGTSNSLGYAHRYKYNPEGAAVTESTTETYNINFKHVLNQASYYELIFSYFHKDFERMQGGKKPNEFPFVDDDDSFGIADDYNGNGIHDGGNGEAYEDKNQNGRFDREFFVDLNGDAKRGSDELYYDENKNGVYDGDELTDTNNNNKWDHWDTGIAYDGFSVKAGDTVTMSDGSAMVISVDGTVTAEGFVFEGYDDQDSSGTYVESQFPSSRSDSDEPYRDGDFYVDLGEPFIDQARFTYTAADEATETPASLTLQVNGAWDNAIVVNIPATWVENTDNFATIADFESQLDPNATYSVVGVNYVVSYPTEFFVDLPSSNGDSSALPSFNGKYDGKNGSFDEYEAYASQRTYGSSMSTSLAAYNSGDYSLVGSYVSYMIPAVFMANPVNARDLKDADAYAKNNSANAYGQYATWIDYNDDDTVAGDAGEGFDRKNGQWDAGEWFADYNRNGEWNKKDGFWNPGKFDQWATYNNRVIDIYKLKGSYSNQINKNHLLQAGFEFTYNDLYYFNLSYPYNHYDSDVEDGGPFGDRGTFRTFYDYQPINLSLYVMDKLEFEDLVVNAGVRMDLLRHDDEAEDFYNSRRDAGALGFEDEFDKTNVTIVPRIGISHSIDETSKLFFSYGHLYQITDFTKYYTPDTQGGSASALIGNMNLKPEKTVQYEIGVSKEMGEYVFEVTGYFKDVYDLINTETVSEGGSNADFFVNADYGKSRGLELNIDKQLSSHYSWNLAYELAYSFGKASSSNSNYFDDVIAVKEFPLDWDERHSVTASTSLVYGNGEKLFDVAGLDDWSLTISTSYGSGKPFTGTEEFYNGEKSDQEILTNDERMPFTEKTDLKFVKNFSFVSAEKVNYGKLKFEFTVNNVFNHTNVSFVEPNSGTYYGGPNSTYEGQEEFYANPANYGGKRTFKFSVGYSW